MITAAGVGSGIDVESILTQLVALERQPIDALEARQASLDVELSAFGSINSQINDLATTARTLGDGTRLGPFVATTSDEEIFTAEATGGGAGEFHDIEVLSLAKNHRLASQAYTSEEATVASGVWSFSSGENSFDVTIDGGSNTLLDLQSAINSATDNTSVVASILNVDGGSRLVLSARESGTANEISFGGLASSSGLATITEATDASLIIDGFPVTGSSNTVSDVLSGVTLNLRGIGTAEVSTSRDTESLRATLDEFVTQYNDLRTNLTNLSESELQGDQLPRTVETRIRSAFSSPLTLNNGDSVLPQSLGFTFDRFGTLSIDETRFNEAQENGLEQFITAFAQTETGFAQRMEDILDEFTRSGGIIDTREDGIDARDRALVNQIERMEYRLEQTEVRLRRQFTAMDAVVSNLQSTGDFLNSRLSG